MKESLKKPNFRSLMRLECDKERQGHYLVDPDVGSDRFRLYLNLDQTSWVEMRMLEDKLLEGVDFEQLWRMHPVERGKIKIMGRETCVPRYQQTFGHGYTFSGMYHPPLPIPPEIQPFLEWANSLGYTYKPLNEVLINWYESGRHYIGPHSDDEREMSLEPDGGTIVVSLTLQEALVAPHSGIEKWFGFTNRHVPSRLFRLKPKVPRGTSLEDKALLSLEKVDVEMPHGLCLVMGGNCQRTHKHQVPKTSKPVGRRINITFRCFRE